MKAKCPLDRVFEVVTGHGAVMAMERLSTLVGRPIHMSVPRVSKVPIRDIAERVGGPEELVVAVYLLAFGDLTGHIMLILPHAAALRLVDMLMELPEGTTQQLTPLEESALGEVGNISACLLLNFIAAALGIEARPSPPAVMVDMAGAVLDTVVSSLYEDQDELLLLETIFHGPDRQVQIYFWIIPDNRTAHVGAGGNGDGLPLYS
ncbi:MAG: CheY-P-specific phosphatase CheC [Anaerolineae bacterium]|nr:chemotaxis protein CheC [Anaerolineae bacterium]MDW8099707.1 CheY-P-specific phosphatase CheC [Anaerolineae bacterium]